MSADFRDTAHLVTGTLDTSGFGEGDLRDVALVYKDPPTEPATEPDSGTEPEPEDPLTPAPLFTADGEPTQQALPAPQAPQIGDQILHADTGRISQWDGTTWVELPPTDTAQTSTEEPSATTETEQPDTPPVEQTAHADKESKAPAGARARRGKAAG